MKRTKRVKKENSYIIRVFDDLLKLLQERPDYLEKLQAIIFTRKFLELPEKFEEQSENFKEFRREVNERFEKLENKVDEAIEIAREAKEKAESVEKKFDNFLENEFKPFKKKTENDLAKIKGVQFELLFEKKAHAYLGRVIIKCRIIDRNSLAQRVDEAYEEGVIDDKERLDVLSLDALVSGKLKDDKSDTLLAIEISSIVDVNDVDRVKRRALIVQKIYNIKTIPIVFGDEITDKAKEHLDGVLFIQLAGM